METRKIVNLIEKLDALAEDPFTDYVDPASVCKEAADLLRKTLPDSKNQIRVTNVRITIKSINAYLTECGYSERLVKTDTTGTNYRFTGGETDNWGIANVCTKLSEYSLDEWVGIRNNMDKGIRWNSATK